MERKSARFEAPHAKRRAVACVEHEESGGRCGGCPLMALDEEEQRLEKQRMLRERFGIAVDRMESDERSLGYRWSSKRVAFSEGGHLRLGSWAAGSHRGAAMRRCLVDHPLLAEAFRELEDVANEHGVEPYDESDASGDLRYAWAKTNGAEVLLTIVTAAEASRAASVLPGRLARAAGVAHSVQGGKGNALRGSTPRVLRGVGSIEVAFAMVGIEVGPLGFLQPNPEIASRAYVDLASEPGGKRRGGSLALDLYAGAGVTTEILRRGFREVVPCEAYPESALELDVAPERVESFLSRWLAEGRPTPELVAANPPRAGLGTEVCSLLGRTGSAALTIMSCGPKSLSEDLERLRTSGYRVLAVRGYDTLPQTSHVELVAWLERQS